MNTIEEEAMKLKDIKTNKGQQELFQALIRWNVEQNDFTSLTELLNSSATLEFIKDYIEDVQDEIYKETLALKLQHFFAAKAENILLINNFKKAVYEKVTDPEAFSRSLPELNTTDKNQPDAINKLMCAQFSSDIEPTNVFFFPCAGRGSDALYICNTYNVPKDNCFFIENNLRLCLRLISLGFKNVICGDILSNITWNKLYNMLKEKNMIINKTLMNPPYDGSTHLKVLEKVLTNVRGLNPEVELVSIQPCDWLENPLTELKGGEYKKFFTDTLLSLTDLQVVDMMSAQRVFKIGTDVDLGIYTYIPNKQKFDIDLIRDQIANNCFNKIVSKLETMKTLNDVLDEKTVEGWRVKLNELRPNNGGTNPNANGYSHKTCAIQLVNSTEDGIKECVFKDGYNDDGVYWTNVRSKNQFGKTDGAVFRHSIKTEDKQTALNIAESCNTNFYRNWIYLIKFNQHMPLRFLPYMEDYSKVWTDEDYCKFFDLTEEESEFMCRTVDDYRVKDFINYISLED
jgi:hypothetical protein